MIKRRLMTKFIFAISVIMLFSWLIYNSSMVKLNNNVSTRRAQPIADEVQFRHRGKNINTTEDNLKYILMWTKSSTIPFYYLGNGREAFIAEKCEYTNCYVSSEKQYLRDITEWDAIIFHGPEYTWKYSNYHFEPPEKRIPEQKYVYVSIESSHNYPSCDEKFNNFFNWTWTYKTDSDVKWGYIDIRDTTGRIIGPKKNIQWEENMKDISKKDKEKLKTKTKAVAWFVSNCYTKSNREIVARELGNSLLKYGLTVDVFGKCGTFQCPRDDQEKCWSMLKEDYFFYLAFENSFSEDYVTEKFLHAIKSNTVPIVLGGADYNRFIPPGSYINAREIGPEELAQMIYLLMQDIEEYAKFFRFKNYYSYARDVESPETHAFCRMCKALNDPIKSRERKSYSDFLDWWNGQQQQMC